MSVHVLDGASSIAARRARGRSSGAAADLLGRILRLGLYATLVLASGAVIVAQFPTMMDQYTVGD